MKKFIIFLILLFTFSISAKNTFKLGFTGAYPNYYTSATYDVNWNWYNEVKMNTWSGWWVGDTAEAVFDVALMSLQ